MGALLLTEKQHKELAQLNRKFRGYSKATAGGGAIIDSTKGGGGTTRSTTSGGGTTRSTTSGGATTQTSSSGGGTSTSTQSGGGSSQTSSGGGNHRHTMFTYTGDGTSAPNRFYSTYGTQASVVIQSTSGGDLVTAGASGSHTHSVSIPSHSHSFSTPNHTHSISIPSHSHDVSIPAHSHEVTILDHTHEIELPNHTHEVKHEIVELSTLPSRVTIKVDGNTVPHTAISGDRIDLTPYVNKDSNGKITRGRHEVTISPNGLARVEADLIMRVFIQSNLGGIY